MYLTDGNTKKIKSCMKIGNKSCRTVMQYKRLKNVNLFDGSHCHYHYMDFSQKNFSTGNNNNYASMLAFN